MLDSERMAIRSLQKDLDYLKNRSDNTQYAAKALGESQGHGTKKENLDPMP